MLNRDNMRVCQLHRKSTGIIGYIDLLINLFTKITKLLFALELAQ